MTIDDSSGASSTAVARPATSCSARKAEEDAVAVRVAVHIRPLIEAELAKGCQEILDVAPDQPQITVGQHTFSYDNVYGSGGGVDAICLYPDCVQPLVDGLFKGYNATVFAYGQTGSGKTYTMGSSWSPDMESQGVIPSVMDELFTRVEAEPHTDFTVKVSFVEIHKEEVRDLLWTNTVAPRPVVTIRELPSGVSLAGATEKQVHSREEMSTLLMQGTLMRAVASTNMNNRSSRSHAIFTITLEQRRRQVVRPASAPPAVEYTPGGTAMPQSDSSEGDTTEDEDEEGIEGGDDYLIAKMHLVDLAGSERAKRTGAEGMRLKEAININKGLLALAKVITALVDNQSHVPYRDSKLTRLLQDSLGGNSRTVMIACVSPADINREESLNTLRYADRARRIKNKPVVNRDPVAAQLAALRQQIAALKAENNALKTALGGDAAATAVFAAASRAGQQVASEALQEAYDDLAVRCNALEVQNAKQQMELDTAQGEVKLLREGLLQAETQRDQVMLRLEALQRALAASSDETVQAALRQDAAAAAAGEDGTAETVTPIPSNLSQGEDQEEGQGFGGGDGLPAADDGAQQQHAAAGILGELSVVANLRARVSELEAELRQVRSLQRMTSSVLVRGMSSGGMGRPSAHGNARSRAPSHPGGGLPGRGGANMSTRHGSPTMAVSLEGVSLEEDIDACSPMTPARRAADELDEPLMEVEPDAEVLAQSAAHMVAREAMALKLAVLGRQMEAKQKRLLALQSAADMEGAKSKYMVELQKERDTLAKEKTALLQKLQAVEVAGAEERKRLEQQYRDKLTSVERRLKELAEREKAAKRSAAQLGRVQSVCQQLQADIARMKSARAAVQRRMEAKEKEFREWRLLREREVLQLRRNAQRQSAALQQHQAMHSKQQAVLKRKTEEAEAARRKLRDLMELQARVQRDKRGGRGQATDERGGPLAELELQPNAGAPLLRTEKARREWVEQELELCSTSWQYQKVLDGELAQRAEATRKLREVQKQLMLLGGLVPPSPVVTAAAAAAAAASRGANAAAAAAKAALPKEEVLQQEAAKLQASIEKHSANVKELQEQWERARADEQSRGAGAADVKRWTGIRNIIEARELLRTLFLSACAQKALVCESQMELAKLQETADILQIKLDMAIQQAAEAKRKALEAEATTAAVITTPAHHLALAAAAAGSDSDEDCSDPESLRRRQRMRLTKQESAGRTAAAAAAIAAAAAASRHDVGAAGVADILGQLGTNSVSSPGASAAHEDVRDDVDIEADNLLHSMGLPPIMEMPTPEDSALSPSHATAAGGSRSLSGQVGSRSMGRQRYASPFSSQCSTSRYQHLLQLQMGGKAWKSSPCSPRSASCPLDGGASSSAASAGPECSAARSYTVDGISSRNMAAADMGGDAANPRLSTSEGGRSNATGSGRPSAAGAKISQSLGSGNGATGSTSGGFRRSERAGSLVMKTAAQELAAKLDALEVDWKGYKKQSGAGGGQNRRSIPGRGSYNSVPGSPGGFGLSAHRPGSAVAAQLGVVLPAAAMDSNAGGGPGRQRRSLSACNSPAGGQHPVAAGFWPHQQGPDGDVCDYDAEGGPENVAGVAKELNFLDVEPEPATSPPLGSSNSSPEPHVPGRRRSISNKQGSASRPGSSSRPGSQPTTPKPSGTGTGNIARRRRPYSQQLQPDEEAVGGSSRRSGQWSRSTDARPIQQHRLRDEESDLRLEDEEDNDSADEVDNEDRDPNYDPAVGTPIGRGASRRSSRNSRQARHSRLSAGSVETSENTGIPISASARVSGRWGGSYASSRATTANSSNNSTQQSVAAFLSGTRSLAAQVSFNHEKRRGWERPVLEDINAHRANAGLPPVEKLTIQLLKEAMTGQEIDGKIWTAGAKTKDNLIADYRRMLHLNERVDEETDIDRITGAATWSMPCSPTSSPEDQPETAAAAAGHSTAGQRSRMAEGEISCAMRRSSSMGAQMAGTARRVLSAGSQSGSEATAVSPSGRTVYVTGNSPMRILGHSSSGRVRSGSPGNTAAGSSQQAARFPVSHSVDGSLLAASGAERVLRESPVGALQQAAQRSVRSSSQKLKISIPGTRVDGPYSARLPSANSSGGGSNAGSTDPPMQQQQQQQQLPSAERSNSASRQGQPSWR